LETLKKVNQYQLSKEENTQYILKLGYAKFMMGDSKGATDAWKKLIKQPISLKKAILLICWDICIIQQTE
jgi:hypothetical protein